jgi:hypothetical protein
MPLRKQRHLSFLKSSPARVIFFLPTEDAAAKAAAFFVFKIITRKGDIFLPVEDAAAKAAAFFVFKIITRKGDIFLPVEDAAAKAAASFVFKVTATLLFH